VRLVKKVYDDWYDEIKAYVQGKEDKVVGTMSQPNGGILAMLEDGRIKGSPKKRKIVFDVKRSSTVTHVAARVAVDRCVSCSNQFV